MCIHAIENFVCIEYFVAANPTWISERFEYKTNIMGKNCFFCRAGEESVSGILALSALMKKELKLKPDSKYHICFDCLSTEENINNLTLTTKVKYRQSR